MEKGGGKGEVLPSDAQKPLVADESEATSKLKAAATPGSGSAKRPRPSSHAHDMAAQPEGWRPFAVVGSASGSVEAARAAHPQLPPPEAGSSKRPRTSSHRHDMAAQPEGGRPFAGEGAALARAATARGTSAEGECQLSVS